MAGTGGSCAEVRASTVMMMAVGLVVLVLVVVVGRGWWWEQPPHTHTRTPPPHVRNQIFKIRLPLADIRSHRDSRLHVPAKPRRARSVEPSPVDNLGHCGTAASLLATGPASASAPVETSNVAACKCKPRVEVKAGLLRLPRFRRLPLPLLTLLGGGREGGVNRGVRWAGGAGRSLASLASTSPAHTPASPLCASHTRCAVGGAPPPPGVGHAGFVPGPSPSLISVSVNRVVAVRGWWLITDRHSPTHS